MSIRIVALSDTHRQHWKVKIPKCDIFLFAGDNDIYSLENLEDFNKWLGTIPAKHKIWIAGNHDLLLETITNIRIQELVPNGIFLYNSMVEIEGIKIWGSPFTPKFNKWAFMDLDSELRGIWANIPDQVDIILTHGPAFGIMDVAPPSYASVGSSSLGSAIYRIKPKAHIFGHIHEGGVNTDGFLQKGEVRFYNVSVCDDSYQLTFNPRVIDWNEKL